MGCVTGHAIEAARLHEHPVQVDAACLDEDRLLLRYQVRVTNEGGEEKGAGDRVAAIGVADLRASVGRPIDEIPVDRATPGPEIWERCQVVSLKQIPRVVSHTERAERAAMRRPELGDVWVVVVKEGEAPIALPTEALARRSTAAWVWPLVPATLVADVVVVPPLVLFAIPIFVFGN